MTSPAPGPGDAAPVDSVLLIGFGGPESPEEVLPFLRKVVEGRGVPEARLAEVEGHYRDLGGRSPYNELTELQRSRLEGWLQEAGTPLPVYTGMRNWRPWLADTLRSMTDDGRRHAAGVILAAHRSPASWQRYMQDVDEARAAASTDIRITYLDSFFDGDGFIEAAASRLEEVTGFERRAWPGHVPVIFTAHSIPVAMAERSPYVGDIEASCRAVAARLSLPDWETAYQSRSGDSRTPWLEPDVVEVLRRRAAGGAREIAVQAIGFLCDHLEVLYDLDVELQAEADALGVEMHRAGCVNAHPAFITELGRRVQAVAP